MVSVAGADGRELALRVLGPGDLFGELALLDGGARSADVEALTDARLFVLHRAAFLRALRAHPVAALALLAALGGRIRRLSDALHDSRRLDLRARLARRLLALAGRFGRPEGGAVVLEVALSQRALGEALGVSRESVNKHLRRWAAAGVIRREGRRYVLVDVAAQPAPARTKQITPNHAGVGVQSGEGKMDYTPSTG